MKGHATVVDSDNDFQAPPLRQKKKQRTHSNEKDTASTETGQSVFIDSKHLCFFFFFYFLYAI